jgi:hypothetical protein
MVLCQHLFFQVRIVSHQQLEMQPFATFSATVLMLRQKSWDSSGWAKNNKSGISINFYQPNV